MTVVEQIAALTALLGSVPLIAELIGIVLDHVLGSRHGAGPA